MIFPTIDKEGDIDEAEIKGATPFYKTSEDCFEQHFFSISHKNKKGKRMDALVSIYVSQKWNVEQANQLVLRHQAWFFTYGKRSEKY